MKETIYDLIIIGGGPAGMTAGIYSGRQKMKTLLITKDLGGQMARKTVAIENYPGFEKISGQELISKMFGHLKATGVGIKQEAVNKVKKIKEKFLIFINGKKKYQSRAVIVASGADPRSLKIPGEEEFIGRGVSYCATCDMPLFKNKTVAVIGGGNAAFEAAFALANYAKKIYILESSDQIRADNTNQERIKKIKKIKVIINAIPKEIKGNQFVNSIIYQDARSNKEKKLPLEGVFIEIGSVPATDFVKDLVDFNERNQIVVDFTTLETKTTGLFAAGDCNNGKYKQIIVACGQGAQAALSAYEYLKN